MSFLQTVEKARAFLERNGRVSLRALQREFDLDDDALGELIEELVEIQRVAARDGRALAWSAPPAPAETSERERAPRDVGDQRLPYTPKHLADKILQSRSALEGERKQVTVLFADVKGSMELAEQIDPEQWHAILDRFFQILTDGVHRFEGTVNQYTGDGIMALFGAPIAHEDHAQRACYAALHLRDALREYGQELRRERGLDFLTRIGLNSGEVVVGKIGDDLRMDYTAQGHTVGLAERAQQLAEPGKPCLTEATAAVVRGYFQLEDMGEFTIKGVAAPVRVYGLEGTGALRTRLDASRARGLSRFVGRGDALTTLELALNRAQQGDGHSVGIVGQAGVGKSRLCLQFLERCRARGLRVLEAHCPAHGETIPLLPILELLRDAFGIAAEDPDGVAREKIAGQLLRLDGAFEEVLPLVFELLRVPDPERPAPPMDPGSRGRQLHGFLRRWVKTHAEREPTVLLFDDIQWIDEGSDGYLAQLVEAASGTRTLLLTNFRPEYHAEWMRRSDYQQLPLSPLGPAEIDELLQELLGSDPALAGLRGLIRERTARNPFFTEEVVRSLAEAGSLAGSRGKYWLVTPIEELTIPATVQAVLASRIDRLPEQEKRVLQTAAVATAVEKRFTDSLLASVVSLPGAELAAALNRLVTDEFIAEEALYPEREYAFRHPLIQAVAYDAQLSAKRSKIHSELARRLAEIHADKQDEYAASIAHHWEQAGEALEAAHWNGRAATRLGATDQAGGLRHWRKVSSLLAGAPETEARAELEIEALRGILWLGGAGGASHDELDAAFARGRTLAEESGDLRSLAYLHLTYGTNLGLARNDLAGLARHSREAADLAERVEDEAVALAAAVGLALVAWVEGRTLEAIAIAKQALERVPDDPTLGTGLFPFSPRLWLVGYAHWLEGCAGRPSESLAGLERALQLARSQGSASLQPVFHLWATHLAELLGDTAAAMAHAQRELETAEQVATDDYERDAAYYSLGIAHLLEGNSGEAARCLERAIEIAATSSGRSPFELVNALSRLGIAYADLGESDRARETSERGLALVRALHVPHSVALSLVMHARVLRQTQGTEAREAIESALIEAETLVGTIGIRSWQPFIHVERAALARLVGKETAHEHELREAHRLYTEMGATGHAERVARELGS